MFFFEFPQVNVYLLNIRLRKLLLLVLMPKHMDHLNCFFFLVFIYINIFACIVMWYIYRWAHSHGCHLNQYISCYLYWFCRPLVLNLCYSDVFGLQLPEAFTISYAG